MKNALCYAFSYFVEAVIIWQYIFTLFKPKYSYKTRFSVMSFLYFILFIFSLFENKWLNAFLFFSINFIILYTQCEIKWYYCLFHTSLITAIMALCELILYGIISYFSPDFFSKTEYFHNLVILTIFSKIIYFTILYILINIFNGFSNTYQQFNRSMIILIIIPITSVFVALTLISIGEYAILENSLQIMITISSICLLSINLLMFGINQYNQKKNMEYMEMQLLLQRESDSSQYYKTLISQNENQNILIHDIKKHLQSISILNEQGETDKISDYIKSLMDSSALKEASRISDHKLLNSILCRYKKQCDENNVTFITDIRSGTTNFISDNDLTSLFCNLLDNAINASINIYNSFIEISVTKPDKTPFIVITVINSCIKNPYIKGQLVTTKSNKTTHGFGLKSINKIVNNYDGNIQMYYNDDSHTFHTIILLKHP